MGYVSSLEGSTLYILETLACFWDDFLKWWIEIRYAVELWAYQRISHAELISKNEDFINDYFVLKLLLFGGKQQIIIV